MERNISYLDIESPSLHKIPPVRVLGIQFENTFIYRNLKVDIVNINRAHMVLGKQDV
jgi:hypothetical protein